MQRPFRTLPLAAVLGLALSACGGGQDGSNPLPAGAQQQPPQTQSGSRHASSSCTPDSYGYCLAYTSSHTYYHQYCYNSQGYVIRTSTAATVYELYHNGADDGTYTKDVNTYCDGTDTTWDPQDPAQATGDPNLP